jgi:hypothetical protein
MLKYIENKMLLGGAKKKSSPYVNNNFTLNLKTGAFFNDG